MPLTPGSRIGSYEIVAAIGAGWAKCIVRGIRSSIATSRSRCCPILVAVNVTTGGQEFSAGAAGTLFDVRVPAPALGTDHTQSNVRSTALSQSRNAVSR